MCGIVGAAAQREVQAILLEGLHRLEYRGYDSAGLALLNGGAMTRLRVKGKVNDLAESMKETAPKGNLGVAHTRWATHGAPSEHNAHPHVSNDKIAVVHNGIIENHEVLRKKLREQGYCFASDTDTEVLAHLIHFEQQSTGDLVSAVLAATKQLKGAFAIGVISTDYTDQVIAYRHGSPLVIGLGFGENFFASDMLALLPVTQKFIHLEDGELAVLTDAEVQITDKLGNIVQREAESVSATHVDSAERGQYRHFMQKEIFEQPEALRATLKSALSEDCVLEEVLGPKANELLDRTHCVHLIACGTSYHAGLVAKYWIEKYAGISCSVEVASEFRYRESVVRPGTLFIAISQSGETADTLAALRLAKTKGYEGTLAICNVPESAMVREADCALLTQAGREIGVASTKAFTTQLSVLLLLTVLLGRRHELSQKAEAQIVAQLRELPNRVEDVLRLDDSIRLLAERFSDQLHTLYLGRGMQYPIALEGALKLKETAYIHAQAYPAGELKHGPLALVDKNMPIIVVAPNDGVLEKLKSNLHEVQARGGNLIVFADAESGINKNETTTVLNMPVTASVIAPIVYTIPLQLLAYHIGLIKGTDIDQPRNLAKSVTVE